MLLKNVKLHLVLCLLLFVYSASAQKKSGKIKFGKVSQEELEMSSYPLDASAPGVVLYHRGKIENKYNDSQGFVMSYEEHKRIKILKKDAYDEANIQFFYHKNNEVKDIEAVCYNLENGKVTEVKLEKDQIFDEKITKSWRQVKFAIPGVKEGSVIEYKFRQVSDDGIGFSDWVFQDVQLPVVYSEIEGEVPTFITYQKSYQGWVPFAMSEDKDIERTLMVKVTDKMEYRGNASAQIQINYDVKYFHYAQENVPALKPEPNVLSVRTYLSQLNFDVSQVYNQRVETIGGQNKLVNTTFKERNVSWESLGKEYLEDVYQPKITSGKNTEQISQTVLAGSTTSDAQIAAIYEYIGKNYVVNDLFRRPFMSQSVEKLIETKKGTPVDLNLLMLNLLDKAKVKAYPVMISTQEHGLINEYRITAEAFDRVIVAVETDDKGPLLIDAASWPNPIGLMSQENVNGQGLVLKSSTEVVWLALKNKIPEKKAIIGTFALSPTGGITGDVTMAMSGEGAMQQIQMAKNKEEIKGIQAMFEGYADCQVLALKMESPEKWNTPNLKMDFQLKRDEFAQVSGAKIYFNPSFGLGLAQSPFKDPERKFPIEFGAGTEKIINLTYNIPAGYKVEELPKSARLNFAKGALSFDYLVEQTPEQVKFNIKTKVKQVMIMPEEYEELRKYYGMVVAKFEEQVVLTKSL